jgi:hypothetical protein
MKQVFRYRPLAFTLACAALLVSGCGGGDKGVKVEGRIVRDGQPLATAEGETLNLSFAGKNAKGEDAVYPAKVNSDGSFVVEGAGGKGIPPGSYKVRINLGGGGSDPASLAKLEKTNQQVARIDNKECQVTSEPNQKLTIDVAKGTIGK